MSTLHSSRAVARFFNEPHDLALRIIARNLRVHSDLLAKAYRRTPHGFDMTDIGMQMLVMKFSGPKAKQWSAASNAAFAEAEWAELDKQLADYKAKAVAKGDAQPRVRHDANPEQFDTGDEVD